MNPDLAIHITDSGELSQFIKRINKLEPTYKKFIGNVAYDLTLQIADDAAARVVKHPSGLWRAPNKVRRRKGQVISVQRGRTFSPEYQSVRNSELSSSVVAGSRAEAITEFASQAFTPRGRRLVEVLNQYYDRTGGIGGGRVMWAAYDAREGEWERTIDEAIEFAVSKTVGA